LKEKLLGTGEEKNGRGEGAELSKKCGILEKSRENPIVGVRV